MGSLILVAPLANAQQWVEGKDYFEIRPAQRPSTPPGTVEVTEVFSYACIFCNRAVPIMDKLQKNLPSNARMTYLPASFNSAESWPMFQRVYYTAVALDLIPKMHDAVYSAVWTSKELAVTEPDGRKLKSPQPTLEDAARVFQKKAGIKPEQFLATAKSFAVDANCRRADQLVKAYRIEGTPTLIVNGRYRIGAQALAKEDDLIALVKWLVAKEAG
ncbi:MAG TPA: thiol:disulfide interchange protein DsbA/DsbL [Steroidobacteraceae bacterium]|nr:thiol:disulfide interchange protein DsbA/DsbL [Steroidobacteraceae bacterium]